jgi:hypothetical protein
VFHPETKGARGAALRQSKSSADTEHSKSQAEAPDMKTINTRDKFLTKTFLSTSCTRWENLALGDKEINDDPVLTNGTLCHILTP